MELTTTTRNATLADLARILEDQHARKVDVVAPAAAIRARDGRLVITGAEPVVDETGVTTADGTYVPTSVCDSGIASRLDVPPAYLKRLRVQRPDLYDANVNGLLHGRTRVRSGVPAADGSGFAREIIHPADPRSFLVRAFRGDDGVGVARAFLSDRYGIVDNLDVLTAALDGIRAAGVDVDVDGCDLTDSRMYVRVTCPSVAALAPTLLAGYRSPFTGESGTDNPTVFAGFVISNSEVGGGAFTLTPRLVVQVCKNGMTVTKDAFRGVHLGAKQDAGIVRWTDDTNRKTLALVAARTRDAVTTFLDVDYVRRSIVELERAAGATVSDPAGAIETIGKTLNYSQEQRTSVLDHFIRGGQVTAGGVMQAITAAAQTVDDADVAATMEADAFRALDLAARVG